MPAFFSKSYFCEKCNTPYNDKRLHRCKKMCPSCFGMKKCKRDSVVLCNACNRFFQSEKCYEKHLKLFEKMMPAKKSKKRQKVQTNICSQVKRCSECGKQIVSSVLHKKKKHKCGYFRCRICRIEVESEGKFVEF